MEDLAAPSVHREAETPTAVLTKKELRTRALIRFGLGQKRMVDPEERAPGIAHILIFVAFIVLAVRTLMLFSRLKICGLARRALSADWAAKARRTSRRLFSDFSRVGWTTSRSDRMAQNRRMR